MKSAPITRRSARGHRLGLLTPLQCRSCPACRKTTRRALGRANDYDIASCSGCGSLLTSRLPVDADVKDYESFYANGRDVAVAEFVLGRLETTVGSLERYRSANRWFDIGCGVGTLLRAAENRGWDATGTEVAPADIFSMIEIGEHVRDLDDLLAEVGRVVRPGGAVYLTTPHGRGLLAWLLRTEWSVVVPPDHLQLFSSSGLRVALDRAGLVVLSVQMHGLIYELAAGLRAGSDRASARNSTTTTSRLNDSLSTRRSGVVVKQVLSGYLTATRRGDTHKVVAERRA